MVAAITAGAWAADSRMLAVANQAIEVRAEGWPRERQLVIYRLEAVEKNLTSTEEAVRLLTDEVRKLRETIAAERK